MQSKGILEELKELIESKIPPDMSISRVDFEGPTIVVYSRDARRFAENIEIIRTIAKELKKHIVVRPDQDALVPKEIAKEKIMEIASDGGITDFHFDEESGEVTIEAEKPGVIIGTHGSTLREITREIGWTIRVARTPPIDSAIVENVRNFLLDEKVRKERRRILRKIGEKIHRAPSAKDKWIRVTMLGGCREVGRSAFLLSTGESRILIDCGVSVGGGDGAPYLYVPEFQPIDQIDAVVLTHAHLDHMGLVPLLFKYGYKGPVYATPPTRDLMALLQLDYIEVAGRDAERIPYESSMVREMLKHTITIDYKDVTDITPDVKLTFRNAGHILGSSMVHLHIGDGAHNVVFTGDLKYEKTLLFDPASTQFPRLETLVIEGTYGGQEDIQPSREEAEEALLEIMKRTIERGGKVLIPTFAVGRSQEIMIVVEKLMRERKIEEIPVYLDGMIYEATAIHTAYPEYLNSTLREMIFDQGMNPFLSEAFVRVEGQNQREEIFEGGNAIILATSGMLNGGPVMEYLKALAGDERNSLVFVGYQAEGTLGRRIQKGWKNVIVGGQEVKINMEVHTVDGFSGHSDRRQLITFVGRLKPRPQRVLTVHGDGDKCISLASAIYRRYKIEARAPMNLETVRLM